MRSLANFAHVANLWPWYLGIVILFTRLGRCTVMAVPFVLALGDRPDVAAVNTHAVDLGAVAAGRGAAGL